MSLVKSAWRLSVGASRPVFWVGCLILFVLGCKSTTAGYLKSSLAEGEQPQTAKAGRFLLQSSGPKEGKETFDYQLQKFFEQKNWQITPDPAVSDYFVFARLSVSPPLTLESLEYQQKFYTRPFPFFSTATLEYSLQPNYGLPAYEEKKQASIYFEKRLVVTVYKSRKIEGDASQEAAVRDGGPILPESSMELVWQAEVESVGQSDKWMTLLPYWLNALTAYFQKSSQGYQVFQADLDQVDQETIRLETSFAKEQPEPTTNVNPNPAAN